MIVFALGFEISPGTPTAKHMLGELHGKFSMSDNMHILQQRDSNHA